MSRVGALAGGLATVAAAGGAAQQPQLNQYGNPMKHAAQPTTAAITVADLRTRLYIYSDDSMQGRQVGTIGNYKATSYIAAELKKLGILPGGDNGTYFQDLPYVQHKYTDKSTLAAAGMTLRFNTDFVPVPTGRAPRPIRNVPVIYGGVEGDTTLEISPEQAAGKFVILSAAPRAGNAARTAPAPAATDALGCPVAGAGRGAGGFAGRGRGGFGGGATARFADAVAVATVDLDGLNPAERALLNDPQAIMGPQAPATVATGDMVVVRDGRIGVVRDGQLISGTLPAGWTGARVKSTADSMDAFSADSVARAAARSDTLAAAARRMLEAHQFGGSVSFDGAMTTLDSQQVMTLGCSAGRGAGRRGGRGGAAGGARGGRGAGGAGAPVEPVAATIRLTSSAAMRLMGHSLTGLQAGATGGTVDGALDFVDIPTDWGRNVIGIIPGSDPALKGEYVAIGAHNDHNGIRPPVVDHDSLKAYNNAVLKLEMAGGDLHSISSAERATIHINMDSIRRIHPVARLDSIQNGADDDGSGSTGVLEIAEYVAHMPVKPKRSILFVWHTGEEAGELGSRYFTSHPTVPVDSIVAQINIDMIGRGRAEDVIGGGDYYVGAVGSKRLSTGLYQDMLATNNKQPHPLDLDYRYDDPTLGTSVDGKPVSWPGYNNIYGRSDHTNYANKCIPIVFFFTGLHGDYHQNTDEPQYIDYPHYARIDNFIKDLLVNVADGSQRPALDKVCVRK